MVESKRKKDLDKILPPSLRKLLFSTAVAVLLFPNFMSVGVAFAEESTPVEPPVEEVELEVDELDEEVEITEELPTVIEPVLEPTLPEVPAEIEEPVTPLETPEAEVVELEEAVVEEVITEMPAEELVREEPVETTVADDAATEEVVVAQEVESYLIGFQVRNTMSDTLTNITATITDAAGKVIPGSYNENGFWISNEEVPVGRYTITFAPPEDGTVGIYPSMSSQSVLPTGTDNVFAIDVNEENYYSLSIVYGSFLFDEEYSLWIDLVEQFPGATISRNDIPMTVTDIETNEIETSTSSNYYTAENLPIGIYYVTFDPPEGKQVIINPAFPRQSASSTIHRNRFKVYIDSSYVDLSLIAFARFELVDERPEEVALHPFALTIENKEGELVTNVGITVTNSTNQVINGYFEGGSWYTRGALPEGRYTITLAPLTGMVTSIHPDGGGQVVATDTPNVYTIDIKADVPGVAQSFYGEFVVLNDGEELPDPKPTLFLVVRVLVNLLLQVSENLHL